MAYPKRAPKGRDGKILGVRDTKRLARVRAFAAKKRDDQAHNPYLVGFGKRQKPRNEEEEKPTEKRKLDPSRPAPMFKDQRKHEPGFGVHPSWRASIALRLRAFNGRGSSTHTIFDEFGNAEVIREAIPPRQRPVKKPKLEEPEEDKQRKGEAHAKEKEEESEKPPKTKKKGSYPGVAPRVKEAPKDRWAERLRAGIRQAEEAESHPGPPTRAAAEEPEKQEQKRRKGARRGRPQPGRKEKYGIAARKKAALKPKPKPKPKKGGKKPLVGMTNGRFYWE